MRQPLVRNVVAACLIVSLCGCQGLARKFRRQNKQQEQAEKNMVVVPEQYPDQSLDRRESYEQAFLFWKGWHEELISSLESAPNRKRVKDALAEVLKNLGQMKALLPQARQQSLGVIIADLEHLGSRIDRDIYTQQFLTHRSQAENLYSAVLRSYAFSKVRDSLQ